MFIPLVEGAFSHRWTITNLSHEFSAAPNNEEYPCLTFSAFSPIWCTTKSPNSLQLNLFPKGFNESCRDYLSIGLGPVWLGDREKVTVRCSLSLISNNNGSRLHTKDRFYIFSPAKLYLVFGRFIAQNELFDSTNGFVTNDTLFIDCELTVLEESTLLEYALINLPYLKSIAQSQPELISEILYDYTSKHQQTECNLPYAQKAIPNFAIQNQVEETFSYSPRSICNYRKACDISHQWTVDLEDDHRMNDYSIPLESPTFGSPSHPKLKLQFCLFFGSAQEDFVSLYLRDLSNPNPTGHIICDRLDLVMIDSYGELTVSKKNKRSYSGFIMGWDIPVRYFNVPVWPLKSAKKGKLYDLPNIDSFSLTIHFEMTLSMCKGFSWSQAKYTRDMQEMKQLSRQQMLHTLSLWNKSGDKHCGDVTLSVCDSEFSAHKVILAQSPVLEAMLARSNRIRLPYTSIEAFKQVMQFLYSGKMSSLEKCAKELLFVAEMYELNILKQMCDANTIANQMPN